MTKKLYGVLVPLIAVVAFVGMPAAAQASPHWYKEGTRLPFTSVKTGTVMSGNLKFTYSDGLVVTCQMLGAGDIWNTTLANDGKGNLEVFQNYGCVSAQCATFSILPGKLPYETELTEKTTGTIRDSMKITELVVTCSGTSLTFSGIVEPKVVDGTSKTAPTVLEFGSGSGTLTGPGGVTFTWEGRLKLEGEEQELITAKNP